MVSHTQQIYVQSTNELQMKSCLMPLPQRRRLLKRHNLIRQKHLRRMSQSQNPVLPYRMAEGEAEDES